MVERSQNHQLNGILRAEDNHLITKYNDLRDQLIIKLCFQDKKICIFGYKFFLKIARKLIKNDEYKVIFSHRAILQN